MKVFRVADRPARPGPEAYFQGGPVFLEDISAAQPPSGAHLARVSFAPGARTAWHTHPLGQTLHVVSGVCIVQEAGQLPVRLLPGDSIRIPPGVRHWHGASPNGPMVHLALHESDEHGVTVAWLEPLGDDAYQAAAVSA